MTQIEFTPRQMLLSDIACALTDHMAEEWLEEHDLEIKEGKIVRSKTAIIPNPKFEALFACEYLGNDCDEIAGNIRNVILNLEEVYKACDQEMVIKQLLQLVSANCNHFILEEHWCYFDDWYSPEFCYDTLLELIAKDIKAGELSDELTTLLYNGLKTISKTECVREYGYLNLEEHLSAILERMK